MITIHNYKEKIKQVNIDLLPPHLKRGYEITNTITKNGSSWNHYHSSLNLKKAVDTFIDLLNKHLSGKKTEAPESSPKEKAPIEIRFIKEYLQMDGEILKRSDLESFFEKLKKALLEKKITQSSKWAKEIMLIQNSVIGVYNKAKTKSVLFIVPPTVAKKLRNHLSSSQSKKGTSGLSGVKQEGEIKVLNSLEFANQEFKTIGFTGKWLEFFGDPAPGFTVMVYALPKKGKSYFGVDFACYLAKNFGRVLYVAREEGLDATLKKKVMDMKATHSNLDYADGLPDDLSPYSFIFLDSVTKLNLSPKDLEQIEKKNPGKSFIYIHQSTKTGNFRGANDYQHDVDMVVNFPEEGFAVQTGRYNQGGEMYIFEQPQREEPPN